jgi:quercetin dioxygenase-like cupin family protein
MRKMMSIALVCLMLITSATTEVIASSHKHTPTSAPPSGLKLENLLKAQLEGFEGGEVIVSRVTIPPHTSLPKHWHPGEEFAYVVEGSVVLWQDGKKDVVGGTGDVFKVPLKQVHTAFTRDEGATILVFRVHETGKPERIPVE